MSSDKDTKVADDAPTNVEVEGTSDLSTDVAATDTAAAAAITETTDSPSKTESISLSDKTTTAVAEAAEDDTTTVPSLPKRPLTDFEKMQKELKDAFPDFDDKLIVAILIASQGELDKSFNALLYYSDPSSMTQEELQSLFVQKPPLPSRGGRGHQGSSYNTAYDPVQQQMSEDEALARKLARKYSRNTTASTNPRYNQYLMENNANDNKDTFDRFLEDDLPQIKQQFNKNLEETSTKISNWFGNVSKKFQDPNTSEKLFSAIGTNNNNNTTAANTGNRTQNYQRQFNTGRRRHDYMDEDDDEDHLSGNTAGISLNDNTTYGHDSTTATATPTTTKDIYGTPKKVVN